MVHSWNTMEPYLNCSAWFWFADLVLRQGLSLYIQDWSGALSVTHAALETFSFRVIGLYHHARVLILIIKRHQWSTWKPKKGHFHHISFGFLTLPSIWSLRWRVTASQRWKVSLGLLTYGRGKETYTGKYQDSTDGGKSSLVYVSDFSTQLWSHAVHIWELLLDT